MHQPVLLKEVLEYLEPGPGKNFIDCTIGFGGHAIPILERIAPKGRLLGIDWDEETLEQLQTQFGAAPKNLFLQQGNFANLKEIVQQNNFAPVDGILFDLSMSSWQIEESGRGFSFLKDEPLDMRFGSESPKSGMGAEEIVNQWPEKELIKIFREYGEERYARQIAQKICQHRKIKPLKTTFQLVEIIRQALPKKYQYQRIHFATRTFQALRIAVNDELNNLKKALPQALEILQKNGRLVIISFHSLEDRIVKNFFREQAKLNNLKILTKKPVKPTLEEIQTNPRSRSAKLRACLKI